ncbi:glycosyltransferase family 87 protein [Falsarthrobacter nasiphocae]|uniref:DUF2029 domain-containing protein n=1 Tax=Falsarthrobacter nasiphocae TaxID=189863 RepID=A0AAE3YEU3_9MICC|nr:glycosyltransferase 87 family protein [Falsarthrobacter nasiphocae]MDR6892094.1 hypothetical protein [Falsarthrobacter nasiphocae]
MPQTRTDPVWDAAAETVGGPRGQREGRRAGALAWFTPSRVLLILTTLAAMLAYAIKQPCFGINWASPEVFSRACYSDWPVIFSQRGLADGLLPFLSPESRVEYPVLLALTAGLFAAVTPGSGLSHERSMDFFNINAVAAAVAWGALVLVTAATARHLRAQGAFDGTEAAAPRWGTGIERGAVVALSPAIITTIFINWDVYAVLLAAVGLWGIVTRRWVLAGLFIGLGTAFKLYPILLLGVAFLMAVRAPRRSRAWVSFMTTTVAAVVSWLAVNVPAMLVDMTQWRYFLDFTKERGAGFSSLWFVINLGGGGWDSVLSAEQINRLGMISLLVMLALIVVFAWLSPRPIQPAALAFLIVAAFVLTNKVYSPQFVIWLVPLAALAGIPWRWLLAWQAVEVLHWWAVWEALARWSTPNANPQHFMAEDVYSWAVIAHMLALGALMAWVCVRGWTSPEPQQGQPLRSAGARPARTF